MTGETSTSTSQSAVDQAAPGRLVLALGDSGAVLERVGGKGASLARLVVAGLPVPAGFHLTTACYDAFVAQGGLQEEILGAASAVSGDDPAGCARAADAIARLIGGQPMPAAVSDAIVEAYQGLSGGQRPVAVRSSATAEDLPDLSFAGQQDSYLNIRGEADVLDAVKRCWASLWTARAISYRARNSVAADTVSLAVVVQELVPADAAGVMFTREPVGGDTEQVVINAAWGLGDAVVGGRVTPDTVVVDKSSGAVLSTDITEKAVRTVPDPTGTRDEPVPLDQQRLAVLDAGEAAALAGLGVQIEALYGYAVDIEWARQDGRFWILQARPITTRGHADNLDPWNDSLTLDALWTRSNIGEAVPDVVTPCSRSLLDILFHDMMPTLYLGGYPPVGYLGGRLYLNLSLLMTMLAAAGQSRRRLFEATGDLFGHVPDDVQIPLLPVPRWTVLRTVLPATVRNRRRIRGNVGPPGRLPGQGAGADRAAARPDPDRVGKRRAGGHLAPGPAAAAAREQLHAGGRLQTRRQRLHQDSAYPAPAGRGGRCQRPAAGGRRG